MNIPGLDEYVSNHAVSRGKRYGLVDTGRTPEDVRDNVVAGHRILNTDFSKLTDPEDLIREHSRAEVIGMQPHLDRYKERGAELMGGNRNLPLPGLESVDFKSTKPSSLEDDVSNKTYGVHPESQASIVIDPAALPKVLEKGKFTNAFEVGGGIGHQKPAEEQFDKDGDVPDTYSFSRRSAEEMLFGVPFHENDPKARPVYGLVRTKNFPNPFKDASNAEHYGNALVDLKDPGKTGKRTTISTGDSLDTALEGDADVTDPSPGNTSPDEIENANYHSDYMEMQWHDHPEVSDIEHVHILGEPRGEKHMIGQQFAHLGIPVTNHWTNTEVQPSLFGDTPKEDLPKYINNFGEEQTDHNWAFPKYNHIHVSRPVRRGEPELEY